MRSGRMLGPSRSVGLAGLYGGNVKAKLSRGDWDLLTEMRDRFPLISTPYAALAARLMWHEQDVLSRVSALKRRGLLRRVRAEFNMGRLLQANSLLVPETNGGDIPLLRVLLQDLPTSPRPFLILARRAGESEEALLAAAERFLATGLMLRYGATLGRGFLESSRAVG